MNVKKMIVREGLILLGVIGIGFIITATFCKLYDSLLLRPIRIEKTSDKWSPINPLTEVRFLEKDGERSIYLLSNIAMEKQLANGRRVGFAILLFGYPFYLLIRLILWAINKLKKP